MDASSDFGSEVDVFNLSFSSFNVEGVELEDDEGVEDAFPSTSTLVSRRLICQDCGKVYRSSNTLVRHREHHVVVLGRPGYPYAEGRQMMCDVLTDMQQPGLATIGKLGCLVGDVAQGLAEISHKFWDEVSKGALEKLWLCLTSGELNMMPDQYRQSIWMEFDTLLKSEYYLTMTSSVTSMLSIDEPLTAAKLFCSRFLRRFLQKLISYRLAFKPTASNTVPKTHRTPLEEQALYHVCGYVLHTLIKKCARFAKTDKYKCILLCIKKTFLAAGISTSDIARIQSWTKMQDRGALKYVSMNFFYFLSNLDDIALNKQSVQGTQMRYRDILQGAFVNSAMLHYWSLLTVHLVSENTRLSMFEYVVKCFLSLRGHAVAKKFKRVHDQKKHEGGRMKALRQKLKRQHESQKSST